MMRTGITEANIEAVTMRRVSWRLMPFLLLAYLLCYIDRVNVGFASLQMNKAVGIDPKTYGLGAGIFFIGYFILEVPSNLALERFGARTWIARIMITWGLVSAAFALIGGPTSFLVLRFLLGAAEAGFFPGVILYLTYWYPGGIPRQDRRHLHGGDPGRRPDRLTDLRRHPRHGRRARTGRLAMDLPPRGRADPAAGHLCLRLADRPAGTRALAAAASSSSG